MSNVKDTVYVFVVCGDASHIHTLHYSLAALKKRTKQPIWIVTDHSRNEIPIQHEHVINVDVPGLYSNHEASIYLKTGLYRFLPKGNVYCYLDSDVVAIGKNPDLIFNQFISPITFAKDHYPIVYFSPYAVNCGCLENFQEDWGTYKSQILPKKNIVYQQLNKALSFKEIGLVTFLKTRWRYLFSHRYYDLNPDFRFDKLTKEWLLNISGKSVEEYYSFENTFADRQYIKEYFKVKSVENIELKGLSNVCTHLITAIKDKFDVHITHWDWQHWNGGVFLFSDESQFFLENWHQKCLAIFQDKNWKTRDQGALIATVWEFGLENHRTLNERFNFIIDYGNNRLRLKKMLGLFTRNGKNWVRPEFVHVFYHFGDKDWPVWSYIEKKI